LERGGGGGHEDTLGISKFTCENFELGVNEGENIPSRGGRLTNGTLMNGGGGGPGEEGNVKREKWVIKTIHETRKKA